MLLYTLVNRSMNEIKTQEVTKMKKQMIISMIMGGMIELGEVQGLDGLTARFMYEAMAL